MNEIIKKNGITFGILTGIVSVLITTIIYVVDVQLFMSMWFGFSSIAVYLTISIILLSKTKKELNGVFTFKEAFTTYFIATIIGIAISVGFNILLFNFIDPSLKDTIREMTIKYTVEMMQKFGTPASAINEAIKEMEANDQYSILGLLKGSVFSIAFSSIFGLIFAAFFKSKPSTYQQ